MVHGRWGCCANVKGMSNTCLLDLRSKIVTKTRQRSSADGSYLETGMDNEVIASKIYFLRGERVILDEDLALLYDVGTKALKQAVRRNMNRFPEDFLFQLTSQEWESLRSQIVTLDKNRGKHSKYAPFAFTEQGVAMLSGLLRTTRAVQTNIAIMRTFVALRRWMETNKRLESKIMELEGKYDQQFRVVFAAIRELIKEDSSEKKPIGLRFQNT